MRVYVEAGEKKVFAGAIDWPGLARGAKTRDAALEALLAYVPRYRRTVGAPAAKMALPRSVSGFAVSATLEGDSGTDFGVPSIVADFDRADLSGDELKSQLTVLRAAWKAFDRIAQAARGKSLSTGPRGGGRTLSKIVDHVAAADRAYIGALGAKTPPEGADWQELQAAFVEAIHAKLRGELPDVGPRGGQRWPARYAIRRSAWHALDHAWEIEDRIP